MSVLDVKALSFAYPNGKNILHAIDLTIAEGEFILLCGPSGCGKTTLINLLMRFYDADSGEVLINGRNVQSLELAELRQRFGVVFDR